MPKHNNSASRLHALFSQLKDLTDHTQVLSAWLQVFAISESTPRRQAHEVTRRLDTVSRELGLVSSGMSQGSYSPSLYESAISAFEEAASPLLLPHPWSNLRQHLTSENLLSLAFCSEILPDEESVIFWEDLQEILGLVSELRQAAQIGSIPGSLRALLLHHVDLIERAVAAYPITGVKALREAAQAALGELVESQDEVAEHSNRPEVSKLAQIWKKVGEVADGVLKADKLVQVGHKAWNLIETSWSSVSPP
jgi:hypothetical protein